MKRKVAIYARVSTEHEAQLSALSNQVEYYDKILSEHPDWELYDRYIDEGITGTSTKKRKNFIRMIEDAKDECFDLIITREVSRFARNTVDTLQETRKLKKWGVEVYFTEDNIWTFNDEDGELRLTIMATLAQNESKKTSQRVKAGQMISFHNGVFYGTGNILGYDKVGKDMVINKEQAEVVKFIFDSYLNGQGALKIRYELEKRGILTATRKTRWVTSSVVRILQNSFYCGIIVYRKSYIPDYLEQKPKKNNGEVEQIIVEGRHEPIISKEDFEKVQDMLKTHTTNLYTKNKHGNSGAENIWSKKLICNCKSPFIRKKYHQSNDYVMYCYQCYNQKNNGSLRTREKKGLDTTDCCDIPILQEWKLTILANKLFSIICNDKEKIIKIAEKLLAENITVKNSRDDHEIKILTNKLNILKAKSSKLLDVYLSETISKEEYQTKKLEIEQSIMECQKQIDKENSASLDNGTLLDDKILDLKNLIKSNMYDEYGLISEDMIDALIDRVEIKEDNFIVKLKCGSYQNDILLTKTIITKDDVVDFEKSNSHYKKLRLKKPIIVDVYI